MRFTQARVKTSGELGSRATKLSALTFTEEVRENAAIQVQLPDLSVDSLWNECIRHDVIKEAPTRLSLSLVRPMSDQR